MKLVHLSLKATLMRHSSTKIMLHVCTIVVESDLKSGKAILNVPDNHNEIGNRLRALQ